MDISGLSLAEIRAQSEASRSDASVRRWLRALKDDPRGGARAVAAGLERRMRESRRLARMFTGHRRLREEGACRIAGVDEVGVGPLAGPVVAAAVVLPERVDLPGLNDSKRVTRRARERLDRAIRAQAIDVSLAEVAPRDVDRLNVYWAALEAMRRAVVGLEVTPDHVMVDARTIPGVDLPQTSIVGGDALDGAIAAASIVAKVYRDGLMQRLCARYPGYGFEQHKGYATPEHLAALSRLGPSPVHRRSFAPVSQRELF